MSSWHSYPSIANLGHPSVADLLTVPVQVEEKVDGSQFSFGLIDGVLRARSKSTEIVMDAPEKMFSRAVETVREIAPLLAPGWTYRGEYLQKPKHNALAYDRVPAQHVILFDVNTDEERYLCAADRAVEAARLGLDCVPVLHSGMVASAEQLRHLLTTTSILGGQPIEGVVIKPIAYDLYGRDHKTLMGKFVSEAYKEVQKGAWREANPTHGDILTRLGQMYRTPARWQKGVQHMREAGRLQSAPQDIGPLLKEVQADIQKECREEILDALWRWAWPQIARDSIRGLPEWYKSELLERQFIDDREGATAQDRRTA